MTADVAMFRPVPSVGLGGTWQVLGRRLHGFMPSAPCGFLQADLLCEETATTQEKLTTGDRAVFERRCCRQCLAAVRGER